MKSPIIVSRCLSLIAAVSLFGLVLPAHAASQSEGVTAEKVKAEASDLMQALKGYTVAQKDQALRKTGAALDALDKRIETLESRVDKQWNQMNEAARSKARATLTALRKERNEVAEWYGGMKNSSADAWDHVKKGFSGAYQSLQQSWTKAEQEFAEKKTEKKMEKKMEKKS